MTASAKEVRYRTFKVKYLGATNYRGSRIRITDLRRDKSITVSYDYSFNNSEDIAKAALEKRGIEIHALAVMNNECLLLSEDFTTDLK